MSDFFLLLSQQVLGVRQHGLLGSRWFLCWLRTSHEPLRLGGLEKLRNWRISPGKPIGVQKTGQILGKPICLKPLVISE